MLVKSILRQLGYDPLRSLLTCTAVASPLALILHDVARDQDCAVLMMTHDPRVEEIADRILWLEDGRRRDRKQEPRSWVTDPVCGMRLDEWTATITSEYRQRKYVFCSRHCLQRFETRPDLYATAVNSG